MTDTATHASKLAQVRRLQIAEDSGKLHGRYSHSDGRKVLFGTEIMKPVLVTENASGNSAYK